MNSLPPFKVISCILSVTHRTMYFHNQTLLLWVYLWFLTVPWILKHPYFTLTQNVTPKRCVLNISRGVKFVFFFFVTTILLTLYFIWLTIIRRISLKIKTKDDHTLFLDLLNSICLALDKKWLTGHITQTQRCI